MKSYLKITALFLTFVFCASCKESVKRGLPKDKINSETKSIITSAGPNNTTRNIIQDRKGNIWIAAYNGVFRYDGKLFTNISSKVTSTRFFSILEDREGNLWFGSIGSGVYCYDGKSFRNFTTKEGLAGNVVSCIYEDKVGNMWFGTTSGASCYDRKSFRNFTTKDGMSNNDVNSIVQDKTGKFWFGTRGSACLYDGKTFAILTYDGKHFTNVRSIITDRKSNIWFGGHDGLWRYNGHAFTNFTENPINNIYEDKEGNIWTSSLETQNNLNSSYTNIPLSSTADFQGTWLLSRYDGMSFSNKEPKVTLLKPNVVGMIFGILEAKDGSIWFGAFGIYRYQGNTITDFKDKGGRSYRFFKRELIN